MYRQNGSDASARAGELHATIRGPEAGDRVTGPDRITGEVEQVLPDGLRVIIRLSDGRRMLIESDLLSRSGEGWHAPLAAGRHLGDGDHQHERSDGGFLVIPEIEEHVRLGKRPVETGRVRVSKRVHEEEQEIEQDLLREEVRVERVPCNQFVADPAHPPRPRREGDALVIPLLEEVLVVEKRLAVREELRITRAAVAHPRKQKVTVRREEARVERLSPERPQDEPAHQPDNANRSTS